MGHHKKHLSLEKRNMTAGVLFLLPWMIGFIMFSLYPILMSLNLSFSELTDLVGAKTKFIGWDNYAKAFVTDVNFMPMFLEIVKTTIINTALIIVFSLIASLLLNMPIRGKGLFRGIFFFPMIIGTGVAMSWLRNAGMTQDVMSGLPITLLNYLGEDATIIITNVMNSLTNIVWKSSVQIILFISALQSIGDRLYEAAKVDGATAWQSLCKITLPMVTPTLLVNIVFTIIDSFTDTSNAMIDYIYNMAFVSSQYGYSAALGMFYFFFVLFVVGFVYWVMNRRTVYAGE